MSESNARSVIAAVLVDGAKAGQLWCADPNALAARVDAALGGLTCAWAAVLGDGSYFGPYHESMSPNAREQAEADVAEYEGAQLSTRWVGGWTPTAP